MVRRLLLITLLGTIALGSARAEGNTLTCSGSSQVAGCYLEHRVLTLGALEVTLGVDAQVAYAGGRTGHLAPYAGAAWFAPDWSVWAEVYFPHSGIPNIGRPDWWRIGFTLTF